MVLKDIKLLLGIEGTQQDELIKLYIRRSIYNIKQYLNTDKYTDDDIHEWFSEAVIVMTVNAFENGRSSDKGVKSKSQGARSVTYMDNKWFAVNEDVKALLPLPYMQMR